MKAPVSAMLEGGGCTVVGKEKRRSDCKGERRMEEGLKNNIAFLSLFNTISACKDRRI